MRPKLKPNDGCHHLNFKYDFDFVFSLVLFLPPFFHLQNFNYGLSTLDILCLYNFKG